MKFLLCLLIPAIAWGQNLTGKEVVTRTIDILRGHSNVARYRMEIVTPRWTRSLEVKVWDQRNKEKTFVRILEPVKERGTGFLRNGYNLWMYIPKTEKVLKIPSSLMLQSWMGSDFSNDDLVKESSYIDDYEQTLEGTETIKGETAYRVKLIPKPHAPVVWGSVVFWTRTKDFLPVQQFFYDEKRRLIKSLHFEQIQMKDGVLFPTFWKMESVAKPGHYTTLTLKEIDFDPNPPMADSIFTENHLTKGSL